ncbi:hypothetical protein H6P81_001564 [Aristolochia fimbriata]|uniref:NPF family transporter n=1 Tax=Aristolochia fimbriata TaxID=158543 RepID=A0AAV7F8F6_ARIFI|nr:hypothetical protein H6P81_001564 [Aristolochia fimbriata]
MEVEYPQTTAILHDLDVNAGNSADDENVDVEKPGDSDGEEAFKGGWSSAIYIMWSEIAERFAQYGISSNLMLYLTKELHESLVDAAETFYAYVGFSALLPLLGAFVADSYTGRYMAVVYSSLIYIVGVLTLTVSVGFVSEPYKKVSFFISLYIVVLAQAGFRPCIQALAADQFNEDNEKQKRAKNSFFNWWFFGIAAGASAAAVVVSYIQVAFNWWIGFLIVAISMILAFLLFIAGSKLYQVQIPKGSPWTAIVQVLVAAFRKRRITPIDGTEQEVFNTGPQEALSPTNQYKFLDKATIIDEIDKSSEVQNPWRLCTVTQTEEVKMLLRLLPVWLSTLMFFVVIVQPHAFFVQQAAAMDRKILAFTITPVAFIVSVGLFVIITVPLYDWGFVPLARKITNIPSGITVLQRIGTGLVISILDMVVAAMVEARRLQVARDHGLDDEPKAEVPMNVLWLLPQCIILGIADIFGIVGVQQFFYEQIPDGMKSIGSAVYLSALGVGSLLSHVLVSTVAGIFPHWLTNNLNASRLDNFYWLVSGLSIIWLGFFLIVSNSYVYKKPAGAAPH